MNRYYFTCEFKDGFKGKVEVISHTYCLIIVGDDVFQRNKRY